VLVTVIFGVPKMWHQTCTVTD